MRPVHENIMLLFMTLGLRKEILNDSGKDASENRKRKCSVGTHPKVLQQNTVSLRSVGIPIYRAICLQHLYCL